ncbi:aspartyl/asparaginyl beta-hydroxylase-like [Rhopilema esculentum]|uniref:aspartyl/asparaginyl beta-hydroxylase-like n=1 Tax=Rhopilema esculentum TaxID=499914 RepID=UPI0031D6AF40
MAASDNSRQRLKAQSKKLPQKNRESKTGKGKSKNYVYLKFASIAILSFVVIAGIILISSKDSFIGKKPQPSKEEQRKPKDTPKTTPKTKTKDAPKPKADDLKKLLNKHDKSISDVLRKATKMLDGKRIDDAVREFSVLSTKYPKSPYARYGKAKAIDEEAEKKRSNELLLEAIKLFNTVPDIEDCPSTLKKLALLRSAERLSFLGKPLGAVRVLEKLVAFLPSDPDVNRALGVQYLLAGETAKALAPFEKVLEVLPTDGHSKSHVGFILKSLDKFNESIPYLTEGINSGDPGADNGRFYFHLGDAYIRLYKPDEARRVYEQGARKGIFLSALQRSLYNADTPLTARPWWTHKETGYSKHLAALEANWKTIRDEAVGLLNKKEHGGFEQEAEKLQDTGDWKQLTLFERGSQVWAGCKRAPKTCAIVSKMSEATGCSRGQIKFSVMYPGTHVWPHTGPTNCRLRAHLGLVIPKNVFIRAGDETRTWQAGKVIVFDDSFEHEVWHNGTSVRLILIIDFWHPELTAQQKRTLSPI